MITHPVTDYRTDLLNYFKTRERFSADPYFDPKNVVTIGYGFNIQVRRGEKIGSDSIYFGFLRASFGERMGTALGEGGHFVLKPLIPQDPSLIGRVSNLCQVGVI